MNEIEEIMKILAVTRIVDIPPNPDEMKKAYIRDIQTLLSKLEKEKERMIELVEQHQSLIKMHNNYVNKVEKSVNELSLANQELTEKVKELSDEKLNRHDEVMMWVEKCNQLEVELKEGDYWMKRVIVFGDKPNPASRS